VPRCSASQTSPFGLRRPSDVTNRKLSKLEILFVAFAVLALVYLRSLGPKPDPWLETAKAELQSPALTCPTCRPVQADDQVDQRSVAPPDSAAAIGAISGSAFNSEVVERNGVTTSNADDASKAAETITDNSTSGITTAKVGKDTENPSPDIARARPNPQVQRRASPTTMPVPERLSSSRYHQVPRGTEKMFDQNWQNRAFSYQ
jgi:hypothetical protein